MQLPCVWATMIPELTTRMPARGPNSGIRAGVGGRCRSWIQLGIVSLSASMCSSCLRIRLSCAMSAASSSLSLTLRRSSCFLRRLLRAATQPSLGGAHGIIGMHLVSTVFPHRRRYACPAALSRSLWQDTAALVSSSEHCDPVSACGGLPRGHVG